MIHRGQRDTDRPAVSWQVPVWRGHESPPKRRPACCLATSPSVEGAWCRAVYYHGLCLSWIACNKSPTIYLEYHCLSLGGERQINEQRQPQSVKLTRNQLGLLCLVRTQRREAVKEVALNINNIISQLQPDWFQLSVARRKKNISWTFFRLFQRHWCRKC